MIPWYHFVLSTTRFNDCGILFCEINVSCLIFISAPIYTLHSNCSVPHCFLGDYNALLAAGGNFGCHPLMRDDFIGSEIACFPNYQHTLTLASVPSATKLIVCIRLPPNDASTGSSYQIEAI